MRRFESILLFSGGIDSYIGWHYLNQPQTVYFNLQSRYTNKEMSNIRKLVPDIIIDNSLSYLGKFEEDKDAHIPFRNLHFAIQAATKYSDLIYICGIKDDVMSDKNEEIFKLWSYTLSKTEGRKIEIVSPFWNMTKVDLIRWYMNNYNVNDLVDIVSCYSDGDEKYCGRCQACFRKAVALNAVGIKLPFTNSQIIEYYRGRIGKGLYNAERDYYTRKYLEVLDAQKNCD